ncbi:STAS domain-containing protein [Kitasatospora sp. NPDC094015]|uniref:STAS domain-containing protein n=1 Tax=Kitasatospora sp. NPDC094015 TaxID=3155205 RepID=UPI0033319DA2
MDRRPNDAARPPVAGLRALTARLGGAGLCRLVGDLDLDTAPVARAALARTLALPCMLLCVDLRDVPFCSCAGPNLLLAARTTTRRTGRTLVLLAPGTSVLRLLRVSGTAGLFAVHPDLRHAVRAFRRRVAAARPAGPRRTAPQVGRGPGPWPGA